MLEARLFQSIAMQEVKNRKKLILDFLKEKDKDIFLKQLNSSKYNDLVKHLIDNNPQEFKDNILVILKNVPSDQLESILEYIFLKDKSIVVKLYYEEDRDLISNVLGSDLYFKIIKFLVKNNKVILLMQDIEYFIKRFGDQIDFDFIRLLVKRGESNNLAFNIKSLIKHFGNKIDFDFIKLLAENGGAYNLVDNIKFLIKHFGNKIDFDFIKLLAENGEVYNLANNIEFLINNFEIQDGFEFIKLLVVKDQKDKILERIKQLRFLRQLNDKQKQELMDLFKENNATKMDILKITVAFNISRFFGKYITEDLYDQLQEAMNKGCFK